MNIHDTSQRSHRRRQDSRILHNELLYMGALSDDEMLLPHELTLEARLIASQVGDTDAADMDSMVERLIRIHSR